jgi:hypothetical protein
MKQFRLLTVTSVDRKKLISVPIGQITLIGYGQYTGTGRLILTSGGHVDTVEPYEDLVSLYEELAEYEGPNR